MRASERLAALGPRALDALGELAGDADWAHNYQPGGREAPDREPDLRAVLDALPEIVAVVKAAEAHADEGWFRLVAGDDLRVALAALQEKLGGE